MTGQAIGPIIGGALNSLWGVRSIFWLLFILSVIVLGALLIFLPETQRSIAGNGTIVVSGFQKPFIYSIRTPLAWTNNSETSSPSKPEHQYPSTQRLVPWLTFLKMTLLRF